jgi:hypothetical protein
VVDREEPALLEVGQVEAERGGTDVAYVGLSTK